MKTFFLVLFVHCTGIIFAATHRVTNINDSGAGSLRQAIINANADTTTPRIINFDIIGTGTGVKTIQPLSPLPTITASDVTIDGSTQPGWTNRNPAIVLDGSNANLKFNGITIDGAHNCTIQELVICNGFLYGISIVNNVSGFAVYSCFLGVDQTGTTAQPNAVGLRIWAYGDDHHSNAVIGAPTRGNLISGNKHAGIFLSGNIEEMLIQSNFIGTDINGTAAVSNMQAGIAIGLLPIDASPLCTSTLIGGALALEGNLIAGNGPTGMGIVLGFQPMSDITIEGNTLGHGISGLDPLPNAKDIVFIESIVSSINNITIQNNS